MHLLRSYVASQLPPLKLPAAYGPEMKSFWRKPCQSVELELVSILRRMYATCLPLAVHAHKQRDGWACFATDK